jgi:predicted outer membrane protein
MPRPPKYAKSVDANQKEIVRLLNEIPGMKAVVIGDPVDVLVGYKAHNFLFEIKDGGKKDYEHRYTQKQRECLDGQLHMSILMVRIALPHTLSVALGH